MAEQLDKSDYEEFSRRVRDLVEAELGLETLENELEATFDYNFNDPRGPEDVPKREFVANILSDSAILASRLESRVDSERLEIKMSSKSEYLTDEASQAIDNYTPHVTYDDLRAMSSVFDTLGRQYDYRISEDLSENHPAVMNKRPLREDFMSYTDNLESIISG